MDRTPRHSTAWFDMDRGGGFGGDGYGDDSSQDAYGSLMGDEYGGTDADESVDWGEREADAEGGAPEEREFKIPEGMTYDDAQAKEFSTLAKDLGLNHTQAQKLIDHYAKRWVGAVDEFERTLVEERNRWADGIRNHTEFGGARLSESMGHAAKFINAFGGDGLRRALDVTGAGDHPAVFEAFVRAGRLLAEDRFVSGRGRGQDTSFAGLARAMYPEMK